MKKTIAVLAALALTAGTAFAEIDLSGTVFGGATLVGGGTDGNSNGEKGDGKDVDNRPNDVVGSSLGRVQLEASYEHESGTFGAWARFRGGDDGWTRDWQNNATSRLNVAANGYAWWKPMDMLTFRLGGNPDGFWGTGKMTGWGFYGDANDVGVALTSGYNSGTNTYPNNGPINYFRSKNGDGFGYSKWNGFESFAGGFADNGVMLEITPTDAVAINLSVPFITYESQPAWRVYRDIFAQVAIKAGPGTAYLSYDGVPPTAGGYSNNNSRDSLTNHGKVSASYYLDGIENLEVNFGVSYFLRGDNVSVIDKDGKPQDVRGAQDPLWIGLGATYNAGAFGVKFRTEFGILGDVDYVSMTGAAAGTPQTAVVGFYSPFQMKADLLPYFAVNDSLKVFLALGMRTAAKTEYKVANTSYYAPGYFSFGVNPYAEIGFLDNASFFAGFKLVVDTETDRGPGPSNAAKDAAMNWAIPIGIRVNF